MKYKAENDRVAGPVKDKIIKEHPSMVPYAELPLEERAKDYLFRGVVRAMVED